MNILFVSESLWMSGVVYDLHTMAEGLSIRGHEVYAVDPGEFVAEVTNDKQDEEYEVVSRIYPEAKVNLKSINVLGKILKEGKQRKSVLEYLNRFRRVYKSVDWITRNQKIDIIILYSAGRCGIPAVRVAKRQGIPIVFRNVDMLHILWPTKIRRMAIKACERYVYSRVDRLLALTQNYAEYMSRMGAPSDRIDILPFPIDLKKFVSAHAPEDLRKKWKIDKNDKVILFMGALYEFGSLVETVREFPRILNAEPNARLLIVGGGPLRTKLEELVDELDVHEQVTLVGHEPFHLMPTYIALATVCISCFPITKFTKDIFSAKVVQYLACGKPAVAPALPGTMRMLPPTQTGVEYAHDAVELADKVIALLGDPARCREKVAIGLAHVRKVHDQDAVVASLESILTDIVERGRE